jgi:aminoglycoside phosphotransferase (APT) family kinase protein
VKLESNYPEVGQTMRKLGLQVSQLLEDGPRYVVASTEYRSRPALFKMMVPHADNPIAPEDTGTWHPGLYNDVLKETALLEFLSEHRQRVAGNVPLLLNHGTEPGSVWYIRELMQGAPMAGAEAPFVFPAKFYEQVPPAKVVAYFRSLHELTPLVTERLARHLRLWYPRTEHVRLLVAALGGEWSHPAVQQLAGRVGPWMDAHEPVLWRSERVIAHNEPYASHVFLEHGRIGFIDWESSSWGHRLHDFSRLWVRFFDRDDYRAEFERELAAAGYLGSEDDLVAWDLVRLVQGVASLNYYHNNHVLAPESEQKLYSVLTGLITGVAERRS